MKDEWDCRLGNGRDVHYSIDRSSEPLWAITAQALGSVVLHQATVKKPIGRREVEAYFRDDLMKEP